MFEQGSDEGPGGELHVLKDFLMGRMMLEPSLDPAALIRDFCEHYYGPAAAPLVWRYMEIMHNATKGYYLGDFQDVTAAFLQGDALAKWETKINAKVKHDLLWLPRIGAAAVTYLLVAVGLTRRLPDSHSTYKHHSFFVCLM